MHNHRPGSAFWREVLLVILVCALVLGLVFCQPLWEALGKR